MEHLDAFHLEQSLPLCIGLAALGGVLEVAATAITAVPSVREKEGKTMKPWVQWLAIIGNVTLQGIGTLFSHLIAAWFGPVSLVVPFFYSATLLTNMLVFGFLGEKFTKNMKVGTYVILVAVVLLPSVGPQIQDDQRVEILLSRWYSQVWFGLCNAGWIITGILLIFDITRYSPRTRTIILLIARAASVSVNLTVSRGFVLSPPPSMFLSFLVIKILSGAVYTSAIVVQSTAVEQARFVPLNATLTILLNAFTGIIIWEDWRVIEAWYAYICIFVLLGLGCDLLLAVPLLNAENPHFAPTTVRASFKRRRHSQPNIDRSQYQINSGEHTSLVSGTSKAYGSTRKEAWKQLLSPMNESTPDTEFFRDHIATNDVWADKFNDGYTTPSRPRNGNIISLNYRPETHPVSAFRTDCATSRVTPLTTDSAV